MLSAGRLLAASALGIASTRADQCCYPACGSSGCNPPSHWCSQSAGNCATCRGAFCPAGPSPGPAPGPAPRPAPGPTPGPGPAPAPGPSPVETFCPDPKVDFQEEVEAGAQGHVDWTSSGWTIRGQRRVSSKASFNLAGGFIEWDMDLSGAHGNINNNFYLTYLSRPNCGINCYCDSGGSAPGCAEMDLTENNGNCWQATTWHPDPSGGDHGGEAQEGGLSPQTHFKAEWDATGDHLDVHVGGNTHGGSGLKDVMVQHGGVIYSSQWQGWVPGGGRCGYGDLGSAVFSVKNLKIRGTVVQGPKPRLCSELNSTIIV
eukprot:TRINITY_DN1941_c0_g1_i1.p1 TRINITY_DN1941_c0_g1~~TRINITY_DN1941_c0_g1_i1.p1  ORF type:complete len:334 (+),score=34.31 TRINITY_DN1941_c0_g1_i1:55-1002(+)